MSFAPHPAEDDAFPIKHWEPFRTGLVWAFDSEVANVWPKQYFGPHPIAAWWLKKGTVTLQFGRVEETYRAGNWIFPRRCEGTQQFSEDAHLLSIRFFAEWPNERSLFDRSSTIVFPVANAPDLTDAASRLLSSTPSHDGTALRLNLGQFLDIQPLFNQWIAAYYKTMLSQNVEPCVSGAFTEKVRHALFYLHHRSTETTLQDKEVAAVAGISVSQLHRLFLREVGASPLAIWNHKRMEAAKFDLEHKSGNIKTTAFNLGFSSPEHFCRWFKQHAGCSPKEYRQRFR